MSLVMQEPTLFNYSIYENILYGDLNASNSEIRQAAQVANALEFIDSQAILQVTDDTGFGLLREMEQRQEQMILKFGE